VATQADMWGPNINIYRDPRWGRGQETPGESPFLTAAFGVAITRAMQGTEDAEAHAGRLGASSASSATVDTRATATAATPAAPPAATPAAPPAALATPATPAVHYQYLKTSVCLKHLAGYSYEGSGKSQRKNFDANITAQDLQETYLPMFRDSVQIGKASGIMCR
jgi:beta-glucosidase-like glycosyl hydrolase